jgi:predicted amidohydrolase YtcJ
MLVIHNATIHTLNILQPSATALAIDHGQVIAVGEDDQILDTFSSSNKLNAFKRTIVPGLTDAHIHLEDYALALQKVDCETSSRLECLERIAECVSSSPPDEWILGHGWNQNNWTEGYGSASLLDEIAPNNPVYLSHKSLHSAWVNTKALQLAGIASNTSDPVSGRIGHLQNGEPDGILFESATNLVERVIPEPCLEQVLKTLKSSIRLLIQLGLTSVHDFDRSQCFSALQVLHLNGELKLRVLKSIPYEDLPHAIELGLRSGFGDDHLRIGSVKLFADGALGPHTAAMLEPYDDDPQNIGILMLDAEELYEYGRLAVSHGISLAVHAIGDRANREVLNAYAQLREYERSLPLSSGTHLRHRIEHVQLLHPDDLPRFHSLDIIPSMQPIHATSDMLMADYCWGKRSSLAYAWRGQLSHGSPLVFGSDAPVESPNPFWGIHAAVTRRRADGTPSPQGWYPEQRLTVEEALHGFTSGPAFAAGMEHYLGMLAPGYLADLLILDNDPYSCTPEELFQIHPLATMVGGEWVYSKLE